MAIAVMIPARNEEKNISKTITNIRHIAKKASVEIEIVVSNDGSRDDTGLIAKNLGCHVVDREDRGYSALGKPELADTHNSGFEYISRNLSDIEYVFVVGGDTTFEDMYLVKLLAEFEKNDNLVIASGIIENIQSSESAVRGSGRLIKYSFWKEMGEKLPNTYYAWESYPIYYALTEGYETRSFSHIISYTEREALALVDWKRYGIQMHEIGYIFPYVLARAVSRLSKGKIKQSIRLIYGNVYGKIWRRKHKYPKHLRSYVRAYQWKKILRKIGFSKK